MIFIRTLKYFVQLLLILIVFINISYSAPTELVTAYGDEFDLNGQAYRFVGVNIRGICHYGYGDPLPYTSSSHIDENLNGVYSMGGKVVRLFAAVNNATNQQAADRLEIVLDKMELLGIKAIVCLTDVYQTNFHPSGDDGYYLLQPGGWTLLDDTWFNGGYVNNYLPWVQLVVNQCKDHNAVFAWELGNEITDIKTPNNIIAFTSSMAAAIKAIDPYHMVTTGFLSIEHTQIGETNGYNLYADPNIDFITVHSYNGDFHNQNWTVHSRLRKPLVLEEYGFDASYGDRVTNTQALVDEWYDVHCARGFMNWGYQAQGYDIGDGDNIYGMDQYAHSDYSQLFTIYQTRATQIANNPITLPSRLEPIGTNVALSSTGWSADSTYSSAYGGDKAYDGIISGESKWCTNGDAPPHWLAIDLGQERLVDGFTIKMCGVVEYVAFNARSYLIQSGSSLSGPWTTEFTVDNPARFSFYHSIFDTPQTLRYVRLYVTDTGIDNYCRITEVEVYESPSAVMNWMCY